MNDRMETEEVGTDYSYSPMTIGMSNANFIPHYNYSAPQNFGYFNNYSEFEEEQRQIHNQFPNYYGNSSPTFSDQPQLSGPWYPQKIEVLPQRVSYFEWEKLIQPSNSSRVSLPFQEAHSEQPVRQESNQFNNSFDQPIPNSNPETQEPALSVGNESDWYQDELWEGASHGSFDQTHIHANIPSPLSSHPGDEPPSHCDLMVLNEISSIIDPLDKDLNESGSSDLDAEPFEKKRKIDDFVTKERISLAIDINPQSQERWEKLPGRVMHGIKRGCRYYFTRCSGIKFKSICEILDEKAIETQKRFEKFIVKYKRVWKTWEDITNYVSDEGDSEMAWVLMELVSNFLSTKEDVELWLANTKMSDKERNRIRVDKDIMKESSILHFYPISQSWIKSVY